MVNVIYNGKRLEGFIPFYLVWASLQAVNNVNPIDKSRIDLAPKDKVYLNVVISWEKQKMLMPLTSYPYPPEKYFPIGKYLFYVSVFGENINPKTMVLNTNHNGNWEELKVNEIKNN